MFRTSLPFVTQDPPPREDGPEVWAFVKRELVQLGSTHFSMNRWSESLTWFTWKWVFPKIVVPQYGWFIMENTIKMDDLGVPIFLETPKWHPGQWVPKPPFGKPSFQSWKIIQLGEWLLVSPLTPNCREKGVPQKALDVLSFFFKEKNAKSLVKTVKTCRPHNRPRAQGNCWNRKTYSFKQRLKKPPED